MKRAVAEARARGTAWMVGLALACAAPAAAQVEPPPPDTARSSAARPFVEDGYDDKPYLSGVFGRIAVGGYVEGAARWEREDGVTSEFGVELTRWNLLASTVIGNRVHVFSEVEIEDGGEEVRLELAQVDVRLVPQASFRTGVLLLPIGRFNLAHDAPRNELPSRPLEAEELLGVAVSQPGIGLFGRFDRAGGSRFTYEAYAVTGYGDGLLNDSPDGVRLPAGRRNDDDANISPAVVGRVEWSPVERAAVGLSGYHGAWNVYTLDGLDVDERHDLAVGVLDLEFPSGPVTWRAEGALVEVELPASLTGLFARRQSGAYLEAAWAFGRERIAAMPKSYFTLAARLDGVDFDRDLAGDSMRALTLGMNFRPVPETAIKLAWVRGEMRDRFNNLAASARIELGIASYF